VVSRQAEVGFGDTLADVKRSKKLLAFDLDGTVVTKTAEIPDPIRSAIKRAENAGHTVTVITGREETSARRFVDQLEVRVPYGTAQGARVAHRDGRVLHESKLTGEVVTDLVGLAGEKPAFFIATGSHFFVPQPEHAGWDWARTEGHNVTDFALYATHPAFKVMFVANPKEDGALESLHARFLAHHPNLSYYPWEGKYLEVTAGDAHKGEALKRIASDLGIAREDVIAFGDGLNDLSMLEWAGYGVAVGEFEAHHAGVGDETIPRPEDGGVASWLEANLL
jgi:Cof subfamily protein (haloacid dehalogenase superfamily)